MKKGVFLTVIFILGLIAGVLARNTYHYCRSNDKGHLVHSSNWWISIAISQAQQIHYNILGTTDNMQAIGYTSIGVLNYAAMSSPVSINQKGRTSRINDICQYKPKSLVKD